MTCVCETCPFENPPTDKIFHEGPLPNGWEYGRITKSNPPSQKGKIWVNNGKENKMVYSIPEGYIKGKIKMT